MQSAALKIICDREKQIRDFVPKEYWNIGAVFRKEKQFAAKLTEYNGKKLVVENGEQAQAVIDELKAGTFTVESASLTNGKTKPPARFTEATLLGAMENPVHFMERLVSSVFQGCHRHAVRAGNGLRLS